MTIFVLNEHGRINLLASLTITNIACNAPAFSALSSIYRQAEASATAALDDLQANEEASLLTTLQVSKEAQQLLGIAQDTNLQVQMRLGWFDVIPSNGNSLATSLQDILSDDDWTSELAEDVLHLLQCQPPDPEDHDVVAKDCLRVLLQAENLIRLSPDGTEGDHYSVRDLACMQCSIFLNG